MPILQCLLALFQVISSCDVFLYVITVRQYCRRTCLGYAHSSAYTERIATDFDAYYVRHLINENDYSLQLSIKASVLMLQHSGVASARGPFVNASVSAMAEERDAGPKMDFRYKQLTVRNNDASIAAQTTRYTIESGDHAFLAPHIIATDRENRLQLCWILPFGYQPSTNAAVKRRDKHLLSPAGQHDGAGKTRVVVVAELTGWGGAFAGSLRRPEAPNGDCQRLVNDRRIDEPFNECHSTKRDRQSYTVIGQSNEYHSTKGDRQCHTIVGQSNEYRSTNGDRQCHTIDHSTKRDRQWHTIRRSRSMNVVVRMATVASTLVMVKRLVWRKTATDTSVASKVEGASGQKTEERYAVRRDESTPNNAIRSKVTKKVLSVSAF